MHRVVIMTICLNSQKQFIGEARLKRSLVPRGFHVLCCHCPRAKSKIKILCLELAILWWYKMLKTKF